MSDYEHELIYIVSWHWNGSTPSGKAAEVKAGEVSVTSKRGNEIKKSGDEQNPAVHIERSGHDVVKTANELNIESKGKVGSSEKEKKKEDVDREEKRAEKPDAKEQNGTKENGIAKNGDAKSGDKRKTDQKVVEKAEEPESKKQNTNGKKAGRPKGNGAKKEKKTPATGK